MIRRSVWFSYSLTPHKTRAKPLLFANYLTENCILGLFLQIVPCFSQNQAKQLGTEAQSENELIKAILGKGQGSVADLQARKANICQRLAPFHGMEVKHQHLACL